jgi:hypothetical protein
MSGESMHQGQHSLMYSSIAVGQSVEVTLNWKDDRTRGGDNRSARQAGYCTGSENAGIALEGRRLLIHCTFGNQYNGQLPV